LRKTEKQERGEIMKNLQSKLSVLLVLGVLGTSGRLLAGDGVMVEGGLIPGSYRHEKVPAIRPRTLASDQPQPEVQTYNGIPYVSGGFGLEERAELRAIGKTDNLELSFALQNKDYLGGAEVLIKDRNGKEILEALSDGPLFFAKLPAGTYTVEATAMGKTLKQVAHVPAKGQTQIHFAWKELKRETAKQTWANQ
jgi:hypothetical protein